MSIKSLSGKTIILLILCVLVLSAFSPASAAGSFDAKDFGQFVKSEMKRANVPGTAVLIVKDGKVIFSEGFGYRDVEKKLPVTPRTLFAIGSASKAFTALSVGILVDEGKLSFDKPVRNYLPQLKMYDPYVTEQINLRDMLSHRSGMPRHDMAWIYSGYSREKLLDIIQYLQPSTGYRGKLQYNNFMFLAAGMTVGKVSGGSWEEFVQERIFKPLGMKNSCFNTVKTQEAPDYAKPYNLDLTGLKDIPAKQADCPRKLIPFNDIQNIGPAGSISSNLEDMEKWILLQINEGKAGGKQIIKPETLRQLHTPQMAETCNGEFKSLLFPEMPVMSYGMGWFVQPYRGHYMAHHGGNIDGFSALVSFMPKEKIGIVVLTNLNNTPMPYAITLNAYDRILGLNPIKWGDRFDKMKTEKVTMMKAGYQKAESERKKGTKPSHPLEDYSGEYSNPAYGTVKIAKDGENLTFEYKIFKCDVMHRQYDSFMTDSKQPYNMMGLQLDFLMNEKGDINRLTMPLQEGVDAIVFVKGEK